MRLDAHPNKNDTIGVLATRAAGVNPGSGYTGFVVNGSGPRLPMDPRFVSVGCESWEWLFDPRVLENPVLQAVMALLAPGFLRVGGISSDQVHYVANSTAQLDLNGGLEENPLNSATFDGLVEFARRANVSLIYDLNELWGPTAGNHRQPGQPWNATATVALLRHAQASGAVYPAGPLVAVELGNELAGGHGTWASERKYMYMYMYMYTQAIPPQLDLF